MRCFGLIFDFRRLTVDIENYKFRHLGPILTSSSYTSDRPPFFIKLKNK